jgi:hypothetical protein
VALALVFLVVSTYSTSLARRASLRQYFTGIYRPRVLARELILGIANGVDRVLGESGAGPCAGFIIGWTAVTGGGFLLAWWLLRTQLRGRTVANRHLDTVMAAAMAVSALVVTPYDFLSYALIIATVVAADAGRPLATALLAAAAVATRESGLLAIAIIAASCVASEPEPVDAGGRRPGAMEAWRSAGRAMAGHRPLHTAALAGVITYVALKVAYPGGRGLVLFQHIPLQANLTSGTVKPVVIAAGLVVAGRWATRPAGAEQRARRRVLWLLAVPYFAILAIGSVWSEAPRLVMPLVLGEALLAGRAAPRRAAPRRTAPRRTAPSRVAAT